MAFEDLKAAIGAILDEIARRPEDRHVLQEQLREQIAEHAALGLPVPDDLQRLMDELGDEGADEIYDDMPT